MRNNIQRNRSVRLFAFVATLLTAPAFAESPFVRFDQGIDVPGLVAGMRKQATSEAKSAVGGIRITRQCAKIAFAPGSPAVSQPQDLVSVTYVEECQRLPAPGGGMDCRERVVFRDQKTVQVEIKDRELPGVAETFEACLSGLDLSFKTLSSPHKYQVSETGGRFTLVRQ